MGEAADAFQVFRRGAPGFFGIAGSTSEAAVVVGDETGEDAVGRIRIAGMSEAKFAGETILQDTPEAFDAAFGLGALCGEEGDAELLEGAAELSGLALAGELFVERPVMVIASENAAAVAVEGERDAVAAQEALE